jgi:hypothetical protein
LATPAGFEPATFSLEGCHQSLFDVYALCRVCVASQTVERRLVLPWGEHVPDIDQHYRDHEQFFQKIYVLKAELMMDHRVRSREVVNQHGAEWLRRTRRLLAEYKAGRTM